MILLNSIVLYFENIDIVIDFKVSNKLIENQRSFFLLMTQILDFFPGEFGIHSSKMSS